MPPRSSQPDDADPDRAPELDRSSSATSRLPLLDFRLKLTHLVHAAAYGAKRCFIQKNGTDVACLVPPHEGEVLRALGRFVDLELLAQMIHVDELDGATLADALASCLTLRGKTGPVHFGPGIHCPARPLEAPEEVEGLEPGQQAEISYDDSGAPLAQKGDARVLKVTLD